jgi:hypothetical protein
VEVVALGPATVGDEVFAAAFRKKVNARISRVVGDGIRMRNGRKVFEIGDLIPQVRTLWAPTQSTGQRPWATASHEVGRMVIVFR